MAEEQTDSGNFFLMPLYNLCGSSSELPGSQTILL